MHPAFHIQCPRCGARIEPAEDCPACGNWLGESFARREFGPVREVMVKDEWRRAATLEDELLALIDGARRSGLDALVLVHGWGSSGVGGRLRNSVRAELDRFHRLDLITAWWPGEMFQDLSDLHGGKGGGRGKPGRRALENRARHWRENPGVSLVRL